MQSKDKESTRSFQDIVSRWVSTEVYYNIPSDDKRKKSEFEILGKEQKDITGKKEELIMKNQYEDMKKKNLHLKRD